ncbi:Conserved hypothetical periplasmic protein [Zobellia galactanivorans]|uniref:Conserved hypothetical periplasmic protein n=2 Tax=Flavobacteriaceae TaxID=49546 RepID=G0L348_ZOBGA|nr:DUF2807 domain-containing protein [Zobellia sp. OII3]CAZ95195.1 Conserved hypothetical periplasmic protein [Zobellia galactanivorans]
MISAMKKIKLLVLALFVSAGVLAQKSNTKTLEKFNELKVYDRIIVKLVKSNENKLVITGDDKDEVNISNKNGLLKIKMEFDNFLDGNEAKATLYYTEELTLIDANENASIQSDETVKGERVEIKTQEGGQIELKVDIKDLYTKSVSGGEVTLSGSADQQEIMVNTGGKTYNKQLDTKETTVVVNAGGRADVNASEKVSAKVRAGGSIYIYGNPKSVEKDKVFGGKIKEMD